MSFQITILFVALTLGLTVLAESTSTTAPAGKIDRRAVVDRHRIVLESVDARSPISVGNGQFAFGADVTGLQTFPEAYESGIPLCTQSQWGWHSFPLPPDLHPEQVRYQNFDTYGRQVGYLTSGKGQEPLFNWLRENPHRLHLGRIGLDLRKGDGSAVTVADLQHIHQELDLWTGELTSRFEIENTPVAVQTCCCGDRDAIAVRIESPLIAAGRLAVRITFPYGSPGVNAADWTHPDKHTTTLQISGGVAKLDRQLDSDRYHVALAWEGSAALNRQGPHEFVLSPGTGSTSLGFVCAFSPQPITDSLPTVAQAQADSRAFLEGYWTSGGAIDLGGSNDPRAVELERRIVLSQYLVRVNSAGDLPPAETGLTCNSWYGKFHLEMHWWHDVHFALWGRQELFERSMLPFYKRILPVALENAKRQGYAGARWPKMVGPDGRDSPSPIGPLLIWQQPHPIYYAELCYRAHPDRGTLEAWEPIVTATADFMASFAVNPPGFSSETYVLGPPLKTVPEHTEATTTRNPTFELTYWRFGLRVAQEWRKRLGLPRNERWDEVLNHLAPAPTDDGRYLSQEGETTTYTEWNWEHPSIVGAYGMLPGDGIDVPTMRRSFEKTMQVWQWDKCWGWDFPMTAMCAARLGEGDAAVDALLMKSAKNEYLPNGHNYQRSNLQLYLPGNGGLLSAVAMMSAGWDGAPADRPNPGWPTRGWSVRWEGLKRMP
jgi:hypothetical protein